MVYFLALPVFNKVEYIMVGTNGESTGDSAKPVANDIDDVRIQVLCCFAILLACLVTLLSLTEHPCAGTPCLSHRGVRN